MSTCVPDTRSALVDTGPSVEQSTTTPVHEQPQSSQHNRAREHKARIRFSDTAANNEMEFLRAARAGNIEKVRLLLDEGTDVNTCNPNGLNALHLASKEGHEALVREMIKRGADINAVTKKGNSPLHVAALAGQINVVRLLVDHRVDVNAQSQNGFTALYMSAQENHCDVVSYLLGHGANQTVATEDGFTPLAVALQQGHDRVVSLLLEYDSKGRLKLPALHTAARKDDCKSAMLLLQNKHNPDVTSRSGFTPLHIASHYGSLNVATLLLDRGADVNITAKHNITPLHMSAKWGRRQLTQLLCNRGASVDVRTRDGLTPLHCAARSDHTHIVTDLLTHSPFLISAKTKNGLTPLHMTAQGNCLQSAIALLDWKASVDDVSVDYLTPLHVAAHCGHVEVARLLLERNANVNARALNGFTSLHIACKKNRLDVVHLLLKFDASINAITESGLTPLHVCAFMGCSSIVGVLLQHQADYSRETMRGELPIHLATRSGQTDIVRQLLLCACAVDTKLKDGKTCLHLAARLGNTYILMLLLNSGAFIDAKSEDGSTPLHVACREGHSQIVQILVDNDASLNTRNVEEQSALFIASKHGHLDCVKCLVEAGADIEQRAKNGVTALHIGCYYARADVVSYLIGQSANVMAVAKNDYTCLHIAARRNKMDVALQLLVTECSSSLQNSRTTGGYLPLHFAAEKGHADMIKLLLEHDLCDPQRYCSPLHSPLTPLHLAAQHGHITCAAVLLKLVPTLGVHVTTTEGYTPLHVAAYYGHLDMVHFLISHQSHIDCTSTDGYTPLHLASQQGHEMVVELLLKSGAKHDVTTKLGHTALAIAQGLGYMSVVETLRVVTETTVVTTVTTVVQETYRCVSPEHMQDTFFSDNEDDTGTEAVVAEQTANDTSYRYLSVDEMKSFPDESMPIDTSREDTLDRSGNLLADLSNTAYRNNNSIHKRNYDNAYVDKYKSSMAAGISSQSLSTCVSDYAASIVSGHGGMTRYRFLVSFMVDARGGAMRGCRHSGVRVIIPPRKALHPLRVTCRYVKKDRLANFPPLMEGEAVVSRILEMGPTNIKFLGPVIIEIPHFASLSTRDRETVVLRSDNGQSWREHTLEANAQAVQDVLNESFDGNDLKQLEDLNTDRIKRVVTIDFPQYFAILSRPKQETHSVGCNGGVITSTVNSKVQTIFSVGALTKTIRVSIQVQSIPRHLEARLQSSNLSCSSVVTIEPRRRKFHKPITLVLPIEKIAFEDILPSNIRLLCSIAGGTSHSQWEDVTNSTEISLINGCISFTTTVSARFWLFHMRQNVANYLLVASDIYRQSIRVPFMAKFMVYAKRKSSDCGRLRFFCITDDKEHKTLERKENFVEIAKSVDVQVLGGDVIEVRLSGNLRPHTTVYPNNTSDVNILLFRAFCENRMTLDVCVVDTTLPAVGCLEFLSSFQNKQDSAPVLCCLNIRIPDEMCDMNTSIESNDYSSPFFIFPVNRASPQPLANCVQPLNNCGRIVSTDLRRSDIRISDISSRLLEDWKSLAPYLSLSPSDIDMISSEYPDDYKQQAIVALRLWITNSGKEATGNVLIEALRAIHREDVVGFCAEDSVIVTDALEATIAKKRLSSCDNSDAEPLAAEGHREVVNSESSYPSLGSPTPCDEPLIMPTRVARTDNDQSDHSTRQSRDSCILRELGEALADLETREEAELQAATVKASNIASKLFANHEPEHRDAVEEPSCVSTQRVQNVVLMSMRVEDSSPQRTEGQLYESSS